MRDTFKTVAIHVLLKGIILIFTAGLRVRCGEVPHYRSKVIADNCPNTGKNERCKTRDDVVMVTLVGYFHGVVAMVTLVEYFPRTEVRAREA